MMSSLAGEPPASQLAARSHFFFHFLGLAIRK